jgi:hypothetical protein
MMRWPSKYEWHPWFAWKPITVTDYTKIEGVRFPVQVMVWLEWVERKRISAARWDYRFLKSK